VSTDDPDDPTDPERLLPGEASSISSGNRKDAEHWFAVYEELCDVKDRLLAELRHQRSSVPDAGKAELDSDERLLEGEADRLHRRRDYWRRELGSG
jgi:hypothetical protein